ncbi:MAG TPA: hypothetical protein VF516_35020 [Kofleriaceae bacterium]
MDTRSHIQCSEAFSHGPADAYGRCPWCRQKYTHAVHPRGTASIAKLAEAYNTTYDPDHGALGVTELERRHRAGLDTW